MLIVTVWLALAAMCRRFVISCSADQAYDAAVLAPLCAQSQLQLQLRNAARANAFAPSPPPQDQEDGTKTARAL